MQDDTLGNTRGPRPFPWLAGTATGIGSMPGTDPPEAARVVAGELPDFPYLPELPARGPGADLVGRTAALLIDMPVETTPGGWRIAERPGRYMRAPAQHDVGRPRRDRGGLRRLRGAAQDKPVRATRSLTWGHLIGGPERSGAAGGVTGYGVSSWAVPPSIRL